MLGFFLKVASVEVEEQGGGLGVRRGRLALYQGAGLFAFLPEAQQLLLVSPTGKWVSTESLVWAAYFNSTSHPSVSLTGGTVGDS